MVLFSELVLRWAQPDSMVPPGIMSLIMSPKSLEANWSLSFLHYVKSCSLSKRVLVSLTQPITLFCASRSILIPSVVFGPAPVLLIMIARCPSTTMGNFEKTRSIRPGNYTAQLRPHSKFAQGSGTGHGEHRSVHRLRVLLLLERGVRV